mmetsp:Transcript_6845/g.19834  ORF Transcript_6845/g.19834 Transcript_6845/m.19834 type:complete len:348 (+) Transcript_6845:461-1504(+)
MSDRTESPVPVVNFFGFIVVKAPFPELFRPQGSEVVNDAFALLPNNQFGNVLTVGKLPRVIEVIVKSLIGPGHFDVCLVPLVDESLEICFDSKLLSHGRSAANGWLVAQGLQGIFTVRPKNPIAVFSRFSEAGCISVLAKEVKKTVLIPREVVERIGLEKGIPGIDQHDPGIGVVVLCPDPVPFITESCHDPPDSRILCRPGDLPVFVSPPIYIVEQAHLKNVRRTLYEAPPRGCDGVRPEAIQLVNINHQVFLRFQVVQDIFHEHIVFRCRQYNVSIESRGSQRFDEAHVIFDRVSLGIGHDNVLVGAVSSDLRFDNNLHIRIVQWIRRFGEETRRFHLDLVCDFK